MKIPFLYGEKAEVHRLWYGGRAKDHRRKKGGMLKEKIIKIPHYRGGDGGREISCSFRYPTIL
jgi:hypothetical protein